MKLLAIAVCLAVSAGSALAQSKPVVLITPEESQRAAAPSADLTFRAGISRGPSITVVSPTPDSKGLRSPFHLKLKFQGRGGAQIDAGSLKMTYTRSPAVDLTERVKPYANPEGVDLPEASVPPGDHTIRAEIKDKDGRAGTVTFVIKVAN